MRREQALSVMQQMLDEKMIQKNSSSNTFQDDTSQFVFAKDPEEEEAAVPKPKLPKKGTKDSISLLDIAPVEVARQVILSPSFELYSIHFLHSFRLWNTGYVVPSRRWICPM